VSAVNARALLRDGTWVEIRPISPEDRDALRDAFERLSPESRYRRFFGPMPELSERDLDYLTRIDHHDHEALVATEPGSEAGIGVARYVRTAATVAEPAIVVADDWQGRGVGRALLRALATRAREEGVERFEAPVLATNADAIRMLERLGETTKRRAGREVLLTIELPAAEPVPGRWQELLRQFAAGALEPARTVLERLRPRRPGAPGDRRFNVIVVGTDGSEHARMAVETAAALAQGSGARVELVGAHRFLSGHEAELVATVGAAAATLRHRGLTVGEHIRRGDPALVLTDVASELGARLIVVGAGERAKLARRLIGGVADVVAERSPCDVLIVRPREG
jgi:nucleotide-binding universal stress UspA family protein